MSINIMCFNCGNLGEPERVGGVLTCTACGVSLAESAVRYKGGEAVTDEQKQPGPIVEDTTLVGGVNKETGAAEIKPKTPDGRADESIEPTDPREKQG